MTLVQELEAIFGSAAPAMPTSIKQSTELYAALHRKIERSARDMRANPDIVNTALGTVSQRIEAMAGDFVTMQGAIRALTEEPRRDGALAGVQELVSAVEQRVRTIEEANNPAQPNGADQMEERLMQMEGRIQALENRGHQPAAARVNMVQPFDRIVSEATLPKYGIGSEISFAEWARQLRDVIDLGDNLAEERKLAHLKIKLTGWTRQQFDELAEEQKGTLEDAITALTRIFDSEENSPSDLATLKAFPRMQPGENVLLYAEKLEKRVERALTGATEEVRKARLLEEFLDRLPYQMACHVREKAPRDFKEALRHARNIEAIWAIPAAHADGVGSLRSEDTKAIAALQKDIEGLRVSVAENNQVFYQRLCFRCQKPGHFARYCPQGSPTWQDHRVCSEYDAGWQATGDNQQHLNEVTSNPRHEPLDGKTQRILELERQVEGLKQQNAQLAEGGKRILTIQPRSDLGRHNREAKSSLVATGWTTVALAMTLLGAMTVVTAAVPRLNEREDHLTEFTLPIKMPCASSNVEIPDGIRLPSYRPDMAAEATWVIRCQLAKQIRGYRSILEKKQHIKLEKQQLEMSKAEGQRKRENDSCIRGNNVLRTWEATQKSRLQYKKMTNWLGTAYNNSWVTKESEFAITFKEAARRKDCDWKLTISEKGNALEVNNWLEMTPRRREKRYAFKDVGTMKFPKSAARLTRLAKATKRFTARCSAPLHDKGFATMRNVWISFIVMRTTDTSMATKRRLGREEVHPVTTMARALRIEPRMQLSRYQSKGDGSKDFYDCLASWLTMDEQKRRTFLKIKSLLVTKERIAKCLRRENDVIQLGEETTESKRRCLEGRSPATPELQSIDGNKRLSMKTPKMPVVHSCQPTKEETLPSRNLEGELSKIKILRRSYKGKPGCHVYAEDTGVTKIGWIAFRYEASCDMWQIGTFLCWVALTSESGERILLLLLAGKHSKGKTVQPLQEALGNLPRGAEAEEEKGSSSEKWEKRKRESVAIDRSWWSYAESVAITETKRQMALVKINNIKTRDLTDTGVGLSTSHQMMTTAAEARVSNPRGVTLKRHELPVEMSVTGIGRRTNLHLVQKLAMQMRCQIAKRNRKRFLLEIKWTIRMCMKPVWLTVSTVREIKKSEENESHGSVTWFTDMTLGEVSELKDKGDKGKNSGVVKTVLPREIYTDYVVKVDQGGSSEGDQRASAKDVEVFIKSTCDMASRTLLADTMRRNREKPPRCRPPRVSEKRKSELRKFIRRQTNRWRRKTLELPWAFDVVFVLIESSPVNYTIIRIKVRLDKQGWQSKLDRATAKKVERVMEYEMCNYMEVTSLTKWQLLLKIKLMRHDDLHVEKSSDETGKVAKRRRVAVSC
uniref:CCHC-type domain-containing protein n=1 Tax=Panagrellus redivivus TaxID=6233 RepID=A0A7E4UMT5_PANRE